MRGFPYDHSFVSSGMAVPMDKIYKMVEGQTALLSLGTDRETIDAYEKDLRARLANPEKYKIIKFGEPKERNICSSFGLFIQRSAA